MQTVIEIPQFISAIRQRGWTLSFAESCTGGLLSATIASHAGVSDVFQGSVVSYSNDVKANLLGVERESLEKQGAVSEMVAREMARGAALVLKTELSVSVTGIAGPTGGSPDKPVGTVWFCAHGPTFEVAQKTLFFGSRIEIQKQAVHYAVRLLFLELERA